MVWDILIILAAVAASLGFLFAVTRPGLSVARKESNDFTGAVVAVIGTTYAVILAFMLSGVWSLSQQAEVNVEQEANALVNIWRIADQLPASMGKPVEDLCLKYAQLVINEEWPAMEQMKPLPAATSQIVNQLWGVAGQTQSRSGNDSIAVYQLVEELRLLTQYRRVRIMQSREAIPGILWTVLIAGGMITIAAACFFGVASFRFHVLQVLVLSFLISLVLVAIADIDRPYQGNLIVEPSGFQFALRTFQERGD